MEMAFHLCSKRAQRIQKGCASSEPTKFVLFLRRILMQTKMVLSLSLKLSSVDCGWCNNAAVVFRTRDGHIYEVYKIVYTKRRSVASFTLEQ